jgi:hypothetical protein
MLYVAKPNLNNSLGRKTFSDMEAAVTYLEEKTGHKMDFVVDKRTKVRIYDWELVGKLKRINS